MPTHRPALGTIKRLSLVATASSGVALGLSYPPSPLSGLAWVALVPLLLRWERAASGRVFLFEAYLTFLITFAVAFFWPLLHVVPKTAAASLGGLLTLPFLMALPVAAAVPVRRATGSAVGFTALIAFYLVMEFALSRGPFAFPWPLLGHTQAEALSFNQFAEMTGVPGLTLWVLLLNGLAFAALRTTGRRRWGAVMMAAFLLALPFGYSQWRRAHLPAPRAHLTAALVQPAVPATAWADVHDARRLSRLLAVTDSLLSGAPYPSLVIWPETTLPLPPAGWQAAYEAHLQGWARAHGTALLTGAVLPARGEAHLAYFNSALLYRPDGTVARYDKNWLVPFAEQVPFVEQVPWLAALTVPAGGVAGYQRGQNQPVLRLDGAAFGVLLCFESVFGNYARRYIEQEAAFLVTLAQDGWWGRTPGYRQHLSFTRLRAIETRRAVAHVTVTGTTALILPDGTSAFEVPWMVRTAHTVAIPLYDGITFYAQHGDWLSRLALLASALLAGWTLFVRFFHIRFFHKGETPLLP